jgi:hypothetical protein
LILSELLILHGKTLKVDLKTLEGCGSCNFAGWSLLGSLAS